jgi:hypothetical protein
LNHIISELEKMDIALGGKRAQDKKKSSDEFMLIKTQIQQKIHAAR